MVSRSSSVDYLCKYVSVASSYRSQVTNAREGNVQSYILTLDDELASPAVLDDVKSLVYNLGARITHEYSLIRGFTLDAPDELLPLLKQRLLEIETTLGYKVHLERDSQVHTFRNHDESLEKGQRL